MKFVTAILLTTLAIGQTQNPTSDTRIRFHAQALVKTEGRYSSSAIVRVEDLGSVGNPVRDLAFQNRWHVLVFGAVVPEFSGWTQVHNDYSKDLMQLHIDKVCSISYVPLDSGLRPKSEAHETTRQYVRVTKLDHWTYEILIEQPIDQ